jgi:hypothetical protein
MSGFQQFNRATRPETPRFMDAMVEEKNFENEARARTDALRNRNATGVLETAKYFDKDKALTNYAMDKMGMGGGGVPTMSANLSEGSADLTADAVSQGFNPMNTGATAASAPAPISEAIPIGADGLAVANSASSLGGAVGSNALAAEAAAAGFSPMAAATGAGTAAGTGAAAAASGGAGAALSAAMPLLAPLALALMA